MASLDQHIRTPDPEAHAGLPFRADCPACRSLRLTGGLPPPEIVPRRAKAGIVAGLVAASGFAPGGAAVSHASPPHGGDGKQRVLPPGGVGREEGGSQPPLPPADDGDDDEPSGGVPPVAAPEVEPTPPAPTPDVEQPSRPQPPPTPTTQPPPGPSPGHDSGPRSRPGGPDASPNSSRPSSERAAADGGAPARTSRGSERQPARTPDGSDRRARRATPPPSQPETGRIRERGGQTTHVVRPGESLWLIAERRLGDGATDVEIANEVNRLWELNDTETIRTGDPDLIHPGQELRL